MLGAMFVADESNVLVQTMFNVSSFSRNRLAFLAANEFLNDLNVFMRSRRATATAIWSSVSWAGFVNFSDKII